MKGIGLLDNDFLKIKNDKELIIESIKRILLTLPGEYVGDLEFGCDLREYLFEFDSVLMEDIEQVITSSLIKYEPRITILSVTVERDTTNNAKVYIYVTFAIKETFEKVFLEIPIVF